jgi:large subunit ribosomal protein L4
MITNELLKFCPQAAIALIHRIYVAQLKNSRKYLASTKTKSEVRGGGKKPWKQKGTGNARAGSIRSPLWKGGGVTFGPKPRIVFKKINKKEQKLALLYALYLKKQNFIAWDEPNLSATNINRTKTIINLLIKLNINVTKKVLILTSNVNFSLWLATRNLNLIKISTINCINLKDLLTYSQIIISKETLKTYLLNFII